ncbi:hypothetical protein [Streptomyces sp. NPDC007205]|uniref:hypothetical protein n=1 Tax=Streptomyces sp. NPDC007205 TaxID=3154316 RepID=UPI0033EAECBD
MGTTQRKWRWRSNPLRRQEDVVEAWIVLIVWTPALVGGALAALVTAGAAEDQYAEQRAHRHAVRAVLLADSPHGVTADWSTDGRRLLLSPPMGRAEGHVEAGLFGAAAALAVAAPVFGAGAVTRAWLDRRRPAHWDQEWDLVGPQWGPRTG